MCSTKLTAPSTGFIKEAIRLLPFRTDKENLPDDVKYYLGRIHSLTVPEPRKKSASLPWFPALPTGFKAKSAAGAGPA